MFARYAGVGVGHDAVHLARHGHGLVNENIPADEEDTDEIEIGLSGVLQNIGEEECNNEDEDEEGIDSSRSDSSDDCDFDTCF